MSDRPKTALDLVPKLRFPEFHNAGEWTVEPLDRIATFENDRITSDQLSRQNYVSTENILPDFAGVTLATKIPDIDSAIHYKPCDILVSNIRPYLKKVWFADKIGGASNDVIVVRAKSHIPAKFLSFVLKNDAFIRYVMTGAKGVKMPRGDVKSIRDYPVSIPPNANEQQRIADCLTSLDDLIDSHTTKLDTLRDYKEGLTERLFPVDGEAVPRLRFPEFQRTEDWKKVNLGTLFSNRTERGKADLPIYSVTITSGLVKRSSLERKIDDIAEPGSNKLVRAGDLAYNMMRMWQGAIGVAREDCMISPAYIVLEPHGVNPFFFFYLLRMPDALRTLTAHSRGLTEDRLRLYYDDFRTIVLRCPSLTEQNRIADCLKSIDDLISAQSVKLESLREHKKGLMQQLFPTMDDERHHG